MIPPLPHRPPRAPVAPSPGRLRLLVALATLPVVALAQGGERVLMLPSEALAAEPRAGVPFPGAEGPMTLGRFFERVAAADALGVSLVVRESVPRDKRMDYSLAGMTCREALELVVSLEGLELVPIRMGRDAIAFGGAYVVQGLADRRPEIGTVMRTLTLTHVSPERALATIRSNAGLRLAIDVDKVSVDPDARRLIIVDSPAAIERFSRIVAEIDVPSATRTEVVDLGDVSKSDLDAALKALGSSATGGPGAPSVAHIEKRRAIAVSGTPDQIERLRSLVKKLSVPAESVQIGVSMRGVTHEETRRLGIDANNLTFQILPGSPPRIGGRVVYAASRSSASSEQTVWVRALSGSPARISLGQVFTVALPQATTVPGGGPTAVTVTPREIAVGLSLEVLGRVSGQDVTLDLRLVNESPTRVSDIGVDRSSQNLVTGAVVRRGQSIVIGGFSSALATMGRSGLGELLRTYSARREELAIVLTVL